MKPDLVEINFCFPKLTQPLKNKQELVDLILELMRCKGTIKYAGYADEKGLKEDLMRHLGGGKIGQYSNLSTKDMQLIKETIYKTIEKCNKVLPLPTKNFIFVFPWFPIKGDEVLFGGSFGFAAYSCVLHLFIAPQIVTKRSLADSVTHEINHTISYHYHFDRYGKWSLLDHIINEGLAENFREPVLDTKPSPWAIALTRQEAFNILGSIESKLDSKDYGLHQEVLFGSRTYKRWTGYSIGYWIVKNFFSKHKNSSWEDVIKKTPEEILRSVVKK